MPKINAATLAEHQAQQRRALLAAARELLLTDGYAAMTFTALAERTGLARPTVYAYFRNREDIVVSLCEEVLPQVAAAITQAVTRARTPRDRLAVFVRAQLASARDERHRLAHILAGAPLSDAARQRISALHHELLPDAVPILTALGHPQPVLGARLLQGLINTAVVAIDAGEPINRVIRVTVDTALYGFAPVEPS